MNRPFTPEETNLMSENIHDVARDFIDIYGGRIVGRKELDDFDKRGFTCEQVVDGLADMNAIIRYHDEFFDLESSYNIRMAQS